MKYIKRINKYLTKLCINPPQITSNKNETAAGCGYDYDNADNSDNDECDNDTELDNQF